MIDVTKILHHKKIEISLTIDNSQKHVDYLYVSLNFSKSQHVRIISKVYLNNIFILYYKKQNTTEKKSFFTSSKLSPTRSWPDSSAAVPDAIFFITTGSE